MPCFYPIHLGIEVYEDGELIYDLKPVPGIFGYNTRVCLEFSGDRAGLWAGHCEDTCCIPESGRRDLSFYIGEAVDEVLYLIRILL